MQKSESIAKIAPAFLKAQKEIGAATKGSVNPFFHSKYADLGSIMEACKEKLNENGISVLQPVGKDETGTYVETILLHESGEFISDKTPVVAKTENDPQAYGSGISYSRRYSLQSMLFIPSEDDDAEVAMSRNAQSTFPSGVSKGYSNEPTEQEKEKLNQYFTMIDKITKPNQAVEVEETIKTANLSGRERYILNGKLEAKKKTLPSTEDLPF